MPMICQFYANEVAICCCNVGFSHLGVRMAESEAVYANEINLDILSDIDMQMRRRGNIINNEVGGPNQIIHQFMQMRRGEANGGGRSENASSLCK